MAQVLFVNADYVKKYTTLNGAVDDNLLYPNVRLAQDKWVSPYLGTDLYEALKTKVSGNTLGGNYLTLMDDYVRPALVWWVMFESLPSLTFKLDNGTIGQRVSEDIQPASSTDMKEFRMTAKQNAQYYTQLMVDYLCHNSALFPEYSSNTFPDRCPRTRVYDDCSFGFSYSNNAMGSRPPIRISRLPL